MMNTRDGRFLICDNGIKCGLGYVSEIHVGIPFIVLVCYVLWKKDTIQVVLRGENYLASRTMSNLSFNSPENLPYKPEFSDNQDHDILSRRKLIGDRPLLGDVVLYCEHKDKTPYEYTYSETEVTKTQKDRFMRMMTAKMSQS